MRTKIKLYLIILFLAAGVLPVFAIFPGNCLNFTDGNYITGTGIPTTLTAVTLEGWVNHTDLSGAYQRYLTIGNENAVIRFNGGTQLHFYIKNSSGTLIALSANVLATGEWLHVAGTYDGTVMKLYLNGNLVASQTPGTGGFSTCDGTFQLSRIGEAMHGKLDDFRFWTVARTQAQIQDNRFVQLAGTETGLRSYWRMDAASGTTAVDDKGYSNGTLYGMTNANWVASNVPVYSNLPGSCFSFASGRYLSIQPRSGMPIYNNGTANAYSLSMWVKGSGSQTGTCLYSEDNSSTSASFELKTGPSGKLYMFVITDVGDNVLRTSTTTVFDNTWHHIAMVDNNGTASLYVDGALDATSFGYTRGTTTLNASTLGSQLSSGSYGNSFQGQIDEFCAWNVALTASQVNQSMAGAGSATAAGLVCNFQANEGSGSMAYDICRGNNGIFTNASWVTSTAPLGINASGTISSNTTWSAPNVYVTGDITINNGVTLSINPGVRVYAKGYYAINVQGRILAVGTAQDSIRFTASTLTKWHGLRFNSTPATNDSSKFVYCVFENGLAQGTSIPDNRGGALYVNAFNKMLVNYCNFRNNQVSNSSNGMGGAVFLISASIAIKNTVFTNNSSTNYAGAIAIYNDTPVIEWCKFIGNSAYASGAMQTSSNAEIYNCLFRLNSASNKSGAIEFGAESTGKIQNCIIDSNSAVGNAGGISLFGTNNSTAITNCTISNNSALNGGGLAIEGGTAGRTMKNTIIWGNSAPNGNQVFCYPSAPISFSYCDIQNGTSGISGSYTGTYTNCFSLDPQITYSSSNPGTGYIVSSISPCINSGDPATNLSGTAMIYDVNGHPRFFDNTMATGSLNTALDRTDCGAIEDMNGFAIIPSGTVINANATITLDMYLYPERTLTINAGTTLSFVSAAHAYIYGNLTAIGTASSMIRFTEYTTGARWMGITFFSSGSYTPSSWMEYCIVEKGNVGTDNEAWGGNIHVWYYNNLTIKNCIIRDGLSQIGGAIYARNSTINILNSVISDNVCNDRGTGIYSNASTIKLINCTIAGNSKSGSQSNVSYLAPVHFTSTAILPQITNCIVWNNNTTSPVYYGGSVCSNLTYCNIEGGYTGTGNINVNPRFTGETSHPYNIQGWSYCINAGKADTTGLSLPVKDLKNNNRIYVHTSPSNNRVDLGAYEIQSYLAPADFTATDGNNDYPGYVYLTWNFNPAYNIQPNGFRILRNGTSLDTVDGQTYNYSDHEAAPGTIYTYQVQAYNGTETGNSATNEGYIKPNGIISGNVKTTNNNPVMGVKVSISPNTGYCLQLSSAGSSAITITNPLTNMNQNFTLETWIKTAGQNVNILTTGTHSLNINSSGLVQYADGIHTLTQQNTSINVHDGNWHHIALVNNYTDARVFMYLDSLQVAIDSTFIFGNYTQSNLIVPVGFTGYLDDMRLWEAARDSSEVMAAMNIVVPYDSPGLKGYWSMNEGTGSSVFDATNNSHNGTITNCTWSAADPDLALGAITDAWGDYVITQISYGSATTFAVTPAKTGHLFQPQQRLVTLSSSNIAANNVDFTDNSMIPISGYVKFQSTVVPVEGAVIWLNGSAALPRVVSDADGYYVIEVEHGTECTVSVDYNNQTFNRVWNLGTVTYPRANINFEDTFRTQFQLDIVGGNDSYPIGDFNVTLNSVNGLYSREVTGQNWSSGYINIANVVPLEYSVTVNPGTIDPFALAIDDQFQSMKTKYLDLRNPDATLDTLRYVWRASLQIQASWPDTLSLKHFEAYPSNLFYVLSQNTLYSVIVRAFEDYSYTGHPNQKTYLTGCDITINDEVGIKGETEDSFADSTAYEYRFAPYLPNIDSGYARQYQKIIEFTVRDNTLQRFATQTDWALTQGVKPLESTYASTSPEIPFLILHDPPGDGSYATFDQTSSHAVAIGVQACSDLENNRFFNLHLGPDIGFSEGCAFFNVETTIDIIADLSWEWTVEMQQEISTEQSYTFTTSEEYKTSDSDGIIGSARGDVFVGGAVNLVWGITKELAWDYDNNEAIITPSVMVTPNGFATRYIYTQSQIENSVIPNLLAINDTTSAAMWQSYLDMNEYNKAHAVSNPNHPGNVSFCSGPSYSYTEETSSTQSQTFEFDTTVSSEFAGDFGATVDGIGADGGFRFKSAITIGNSSSSSTETTTTSSFVLADDDVTSELTTNSDYFTVDVVEDPVYGTPVFNLISGVSSNPWEPNTQPRDGVMMTANTYTSSDLSMGSAAVFLLYLTNTSQSNEPRRYYLAVQQGTNSMGAIVKINGVTLENQMAFDIDAGATVQAVLTVEQGPIGYELEGLTLEFYTLGDRGNNGPDGHYFDIFKSFNIYWEAPYSRVAISYPQDNWIINQNSSNNLDILLRDYDLTKPNFRSVKIQYKHPADLDWIPALEIMRDSLVIHPRYISVPWDVTSLADGIYEIRAATTDSIQADWFTGSLTGVIDRSSPEIWGLPQPSDGILQLGDVISLTFNEKINPLSIIPGRVAMRVVSTNMVVDATVQCYDNTISIVPNIANYWLENETIEVQVHSLTDLYGNPMEGTTSWEFFDNSNPVNWQTTKIEVIKPLGQEMTLSTNLINTGGQFSSFTLQDLPLWMTATPMTGSLLALDTRTITFTVSSQLGFGTFTDTLYADIPGLGREPLVVKVSVLASPPAWTANVNYNYEFTMTITGRLVIDNVTSTDVNDIIGAFILNESGDYECSGVAHTEYVSYLGGSYQFFLTIYNNFDNSQPILFRVWDDDQAKEHYGIIEEYTFLSGEIYGTPVTPTNIHTTQQLVQDIHCGSGWTWISTNLLNTQSMSTNNVLQSLSPHPNDLIRNQTQHSQYTTEVGWVGAVNTISNTQMYKLKLADSDNLEMIGTLQNPVTTTITYGSGWNWISYIPHVSISVGEALAGISNLATGDIIKSQRAYAQYISGYGWAGSLRFMNPGEGFLLKMANPGSFHYPDYQIPRDGQRFRDTEPLPEVPGWELNPLAYEYSANVTGVMHINGLPVLDDVIIGAFVGNQCRGIVSSMEVMGSRMYFLTVYANPIPTNETITFKAYFPDSESTIDISTTLQFVNNQITGNPNNPYVFNIPNLPLTAPQNVAIEIAGANVQISWAATPGATSYKVFASDVPDSGFVDVTSQGSFIRNDTRPLESFSNNRSEDNRSRVSWTSNNTTGLKKFYYVKATQNN